MLDTTWNAIQAALGLDAEQLNAAQMALRAVLTFVVTIAILRLGAKRLFGKGTAFDYVVAVMIGSIMSSAINGSATLLGAWVAGAVLVGLHWLLSYLSSRLSWFGPLVKGHPIDLIRDGRVLEDGLREGKLSSNDLDQALRDQGSEPDPSNIKRAVLERDGSISVIPFKSEPKILEVSVEDSVQTVRIAAE